MKRRDGIEVGRALSDQIEEFLGREVLSGDKRLQSDGALVEVLCLQHLERVSSCGQLFHGVNEVVKIRADELSGGRF